MWALTGASLAFVLVLGSPPVDFLYTGILKLLTWILFKRDKHVEDEGLIDEYDSDEKKYEIMRRRHKAIEELAATLEEEDIGLKEQPEDTEE